MLCAEQCQFPGVGLLLVANDIRVAVVASQLEVSVVGRQPRVDKLHDGDAAVSENQRPRCLLAAMPGVALYADGEEPLVTHRIALSSASVSPLCRKSSAPAASAGRRTPGVNTMLGKLSKKVAKVVKKPAAQVVRRAVTPRKAVAAPSGQISASKRIDKRIAELGDWRGERLAEIRKIIHEVDPEVVEEWKWMGSP